MSTHTPDQYVLIWTEPSSRKLRTYVHPDNLRLPVSATLDAFSPPLSPDRVIDSHPQMVEFIRGNAPEGPLAVRTDIAAEALGWDSTPAATRDNETHDQ